MSWIPAICGGEPAFPSGPPPWPLDDPDVLAALEQTYRDRSWGKYQGPNLDRLTEQLRRLTCVEHVVPCSSGTVAVELALRGLGVGAGDEVILGGYDFPGNFRAVEAVGAVPVLVDLEPSGRTIDVDQVTTGWSSATKAVVATHLHGGLVDMPRLIALAGERGGAVVEDACQAPGAVVAGRPAGAWGDVGVFSFGGSKLLSAGRGGALVTPRDDVRQRIKVFCERGNQAFPLSELQAAVLVPQLEKLPERHRRRLAAAGRLLERLVAVPGLAPVDHLLPNSEPAFYKLGLMYDPDALGGYARDEFIAAGRAEGIALDAGFRGFASRGARRCRRVGDLPVASAAARSTIILHHPVLSEEFDVIDRLADTLVRLADVFRRRAVTFTDVPPPPAADEES